MVFSIGFLFMCFGVGWVLKLSAMKNSHVSAMLSGQKNANTKRVGTKHRVGITPILSFCVAPYRP